MSNLKILNTRVRINNEGLYSLNDLLKASKASKNTARNKTPKEWVKLKRTKALINEVKKVNISTENLSIKSSNKAGTFACQELVIAYAMHISPIFELEVIKAFLKDAKDKLKLAEIHGKAEYHQNRIEGKRIHIYSTDIQKEFGRYAANQGSSFYGKDSNIYMMFGKLLKSAIGFENRDELTPDRLSLLSVCEQVIDARLISGMKQGLAYKKIYEEARNAVLDLVDSMDKSGEVE